MVIPIDQLQEEFKAFQHFVNYDMVEGGACKVNTPCLTVCGESGGSLEFEYNIETGQYYLVCGMIKINIE